MRADDHRLAAELAAGAGRLLLQLREKGGRSDWAVHVALWAGGDLVAGAVVQWGVFGVPTTRDALGLSPSSMCT
jgi:hypothetical protein